MTKETTDLMHAGRAYLKAYRELREKFRGVKRLATDENFMAEKIMLEVMASQSSALLHADTDPLQSMLKLQQIDPIRVAFQLYLDSFKSLKNKYDKVVNVDLHKGFVAEMGTVEQTFRNSLQQTIIIEQMKLLMAKLG